MTEPSEPDPFAELLGELSDGKRWALVRAEGWDEFIQRLSSLVADLDPRRRRALMMILFALAYEQLTPADAKAWIDAHDIDSDEGLDAMITWLRKFRPPQPPPDLT